MGGNSQECPFEPALSALIARVYKIPCAFAMIVYIALKESIQRDSQGINPKSVSNILIDLSTSSLSSEYLIAPQRTLL
jgi:hypothetical protein